MYDATSDTLTGTYTLQGPLAPNVSSHESFCPVHTPDGTWVGRLGANSNELWAYTWASNGDSNIELWKDSAGEYGASGTSELKQGFNTVPEKISDASLLRYSPLYEGAGSVVYELANATYGIVKGGATQGAVGPLGTNATTSGAFQTQ